MNITTSLSLLLLFSVDLLAQSGYELVWSDEFNYTGLPDTKKWSYDVGDGCPNVCGWGNNELEYYTESKLENARVDGEHLIITARKENIGTKQYSSARMVTKEKGDWTYGRIEVRAKLPSGKGTWPAIWMLPTDWSYGGWPDSGEIDIMEHVGYEPNQIYGTVHTNAYNHSINTQKGGDIEVLDCEDQFHTYAVEWNHDKIDFFVDNNQYFDFSKEGGFEKWPFDKRFHLIMNIAVGGNWGGAEGVDEIVFPQEMKVDFVRVYQLVSNLNKKNGTGKLLLYPNPVRTRQFTIQSDQSEWDEIRIHDVMGKQVSYDKSIQSGSIVVHLDDELNQMLMVSLIRNKELVSHGKLIPFLMID